MPRTWASIALLTLAITACPAGSGPAAACASDRVLREGDQLPDCTFPLIDGSGELSLESLRGEPLVLNFWASWCLPCLKEMPALDRFARAHPDIRMLGANPVINGETEAAAAHYFEERDVSYESIIDRDGQLYGHFNSVMRPVMPLTVIVDEDGTVVARHFGELDEAGLEQKVADALE